MRVFKKLSIMARFDIKHFFFLEKRKPVLKEKLLSLVKLSFLKKSFSWKSV